MSDILDKMIADLKEGASRSEGFLRGGHVGVEVARERRGREEKLAMSPGVAGLLGSLAGGLGGGAIGGAPGAALGLLAGPLAAAAQSDEGNRAGGALGNFFGGIGGGLGGGALGAGAGAGIGALAGNPGLGAMIGGGLGGLGGSMLGQHALANRWGEDDVTKAKNKVKEKVSALEQSHAEGAKAAADHFGVKEALLPLIGSLAGGALLRGGLGMAARRFGGNAVGRAAQGALNFGAKGGWRGNALDMAGSTLGGMAGAQLQGQQG